MDIEDGFGKALGAFLVVWVLSAIASLAVIGVAIWGIITLVLHFT